MEQITALRIGIIGAMDMEVETLREAAGTTANCTIAGMEFSEGSFGSHQVVIAKSGVGKVNAGICAQIMITHFRVDCIINTGVAGSLDERIEIGDLVVSEDAVQHDFDACALGFQAGAIPFDGLFAFPADETLRARARMAAAEAAPELGVFEGRVCSGDQFIASHAQRESIRRRFGGLCCEMEGAAIAQVCHLNRIPWVVLRVISDHAGDSEEVSFALFADNAARNCARIVRTMIEG